MRNALARFRSNDQEGRLLGQLLIISRDVERHAVYISFPLDVQDKGVFRVKFVASPSGGKTPEVLVGFGRVRHLAIDPSSDPRRSGSYDAVLTLQDGSVRTIPLDENGQGIFSSRKKDGRAENAASGRVEKAMTNTMGAQSPGAIGLPDMALMNGIQNGGIDLARNRLGLRVHHSAEEMRFKFDPAMVERLQDASGLAPDIIGIQPMEVPVPVFLGLRAVSAAGMNNEGTSQVRGLRGCSGGTLGRQHKTGIV
jgi:hypothetical protein